MTKRKTKAKAEIKYLELMTPIGKRLRECSNVDLMQISEIIGVAPTIGEMVEAGEDVGDIFSGKISEFTLKRVLRELVARQAA